MMMKPMPLACFVAMFLSAEKMSKNQKPDGLTPLGRKLASLMSATQMRMTKPAKKSTMWVE